MPAIVIIGAQWGDEGKGKIVDHLAERAAMVVRYQGGNNAGHTVVIGDTVLKLHQIPSGITRPHVAAVLGHGMVINPPALMEELDILAAEGIPTDNLHISPGAHVVMPYHLLLDRLEEDLRGAHALGTTRKGIGPCYTDKVARRGLRVRDLVDPDRFAACTEQVLDRVNRELTGVFGHPPMAVEEIVDAYAPAARRIAPYVEDTGRLIHEALAREGDDPHGGRPGHHAGYRLWHLSVRHLLPPRRAPARSGVSPLRCAAWSAWSRPTPRASAPGLSPRNSWTRWATGSSSGATSTAPPPGGAGAAAGWTWWPCATRRG